MKYSYQWLQKHIEEPLPNPESLKEAIIFHAFEVESMEDVGSDTIFDINVLPDRAGDCLSHYGMAREIAGLLNLTLRALAISPLAHDTLDLPIEVTTDGCRRYIAVGMDGVTIGPSPEWLKNALESIGQRSINNVVDATNYILFDTGQPVHVFDRKKIDGGITVRNARDGESIVTLSDEQKILSPSMMVVADYVGPMAIAGVKGGKTAEITDRGTTSVVLEIANFDPTVVRKTARELGIQTDAVKRFENNLSPVVAADAAALLVSLIADIAGGSVTGVAEYYPTPVSRRLLSFETSDITRLLGTEVIDGSAIEDVFQRYRYEYKKDGDQFVLTVPYWRDDIVGAHNIAEEVGRVVGYGRIDPLPLPFAPTVAHSPVWRALQDARAALLVDGYREVMTYTFVKKGDVYVSRGPTNKSALRTNLSGALAEKYELNRLNAPLLGFEGVKLFEIGNIFLADREEVRVAYVDAGIVTEVSLDAFCAEHKAQPVSQVVAVQSAHRFVPWSVYPFIVRDIAVWVETPADRTRLESIVTDFANEYCVQPPILFDEFTKDTKTSVAFHLVFQSHERTLTEEEVEVWFSHLTDTIARDPAFKLR